MTTTFLNIRALEERLSGPGSEPGFESDESLGGKGDVGGEVIEFALHASQASPIALGEPAEPVRHAYLGRDAAEAFTGFWSTLSKSSWGGGVMRCCPH